MILSCIGQPKPKIFFIGIGGISMSALAKYLIINGFIVSGSDKSRNSNTDYLSELGCKIFIGHSKSNVIGQDVVVYNSAITSENEELIYATTLKMCILKRVELLQIIADSFTKSVGFSGSHGKTTATAMFSHVLLRSGIGFTSHIGGWDNCLGNLFQSGKEIFVTEVCEYDRNIEHFKSNVATVLNVDNDHMDCYSDIEDLKKCFWSYLSRADVSVINSDDERLKTFARKSITFGKSTKCDYSAKILSSHKNYVSVRFLEFGKKLFDAKIKVFGQFNVYNALSAVASARVLEIPEKTINSGISNFIGVKRRNEIIGNINGATVIADYAHHPKELKCILDSYISSGKQVVAVFQPHTFSRTKLLFKDFESVLETVENLFIYKTYPARETPFDGYSAEYLACDMNCKNYYDDINELFSALKNKINKNQVVLILGAGDLYDEMKKKLASNH